MEGQFPPKMAFTRIRIQNEFQVRLAGTESDEFKSKSESGAFQPTPQMPRASRKAKASDPPYTPCVPGKVTAKQEFIS